MVNGEIMDNPGRVIVASALLALASSPAFAAIAVDDYYTMSTQDAVLYFTPWSNDQLVNWTPNFTAADFELIQGQGTLQITTDGPLFTPAPGFLGTAAYRYTVTDGNGSDQAVTYIEVVSSAADVLAIQDTFYVPTNAAATTLRVRSNDRFALANGPDASVQNPGNTSSAEGGTLALPPNSFGDTIDYTPPAGFTGIDSFTYTIEGQGQSSSAVATVYVGIEPGGNLITPGGLTNEEARAFAVLVDACDQGNSTIPCNDIANLTPEEQKQLIQQLSGRHAKLQARALRQLQRQQSGNISQRLKEIRSQRNQISVNSLNLTVLGDTLPLGQALQGSLRGGSAGDGELVSPWGAFINGDISVGESKETASRPGYDQDGYSLTLGVDYRLSETVVVGGAAGIGESDTDFVSTQGNQDSRSFSLISFGNVYLADNLYLDGLAMWTQGRLDVARRVQVGSIQQDLRSDTSSQQLTAASSLGYEVNVQRWQSAFYGRLEYSDLNVDGYTEKGGSFGLNVGEQSTHSLTSALGTRVGYVFSWSKGVLVPSFELEYVKESSDSFNITNQFADAVAAGSFRISVDEPDTEYLTLSTSLSAVFSGGRSAFLRYETLLLQDTYDFSSYSIGFRTEF